MKQVYNFSAGPSNLPTNVLEIAQHELIKYKDTQISVMEMSHRTQDYLTIHNHAKSLLLELLDLDQKDYDVLFIQGGASMQFTMIPLNYGQTKTPYYINSGIWSQRALEEAKIINRNAKEIQITNIPKKGAYLHLTTNDTIDGTSIYNLPKTNLPIVADMSSNILSYQYDFKEFDLIYAGAQKNLGPAGVTIVILNKEFIPTTSHRLPTLLDYRTFITHNSLFNTPPTYTIYIVREVLQWVKNMGGVKQMEKEARKKSNLLYKTIDHSKLFKNKININDRSITNITFTTGSNSLDSLFIEKANKEGLLNLKGHRITGGMRASIYNAMPYLGVKKLSEFMKEFDKKYAHVSHSNL